LLQTTKSLPLLCEDLASVGTATKYRKQGAASLCVEWGTRLADEKGLPGYVESTPSGINVYRKYGFEIVDRLKLELSPWNEKEYWNVCMIRPAKKGP
jgi:predicted acetyltransferase